MSRTSRSDRRRVGLVTDAGSRVGSALCQALAADYDLVAAYRSDPPLVPRQDAELFDPVRPRAAVPENRDRVFAVRADLTSRPDAERLVELALARFGSVDLLVNNAAEAGSRSLTTDPASVELGAAQLVTDVVAPVYLAALLATVAWRADEHGNRLRNRCVVNVVGAAGRGRGWAFSRASRAAVTVLSRQMAAEYRPLGVRVNAITSADVTDVSALDALVETLLELDAGHDTGRVVALDRTSTGPGTAGSGQARTPKVAT